MRTLLVIVSLLLSVGCASTKSAEGTTATAAALKKPGEATLGDRTTCPVSGEVFTVDSDSPKVEFEGKTYFFCCNDCVADFQKDPAKFIAKLSGP